MSEICPTPSLEQSEQLVSKVERTPEDIAKGRERIEGQIKQYKVLYEAHIEQEAIEREGLEVAMDKVLAELDNSAVGKWYKETTGVELSEAKQTPWGTIGANTLEGGQSLANIIIHPIDTAKAVGQFIWSPIDSTKEVAHRYSQEWKYSNAWGKTGLIWRGSFEIVFGAKGATTISKVGKVGYKSGKVGKLGKGVQNAIGGIEGGIANHTPKVVMAATGALAVGANKVAEKVPEGVKTFTKEQSRVGIIDNPLDGKIASLKKTEVKATAVGEVGVVGENIVAKSEHLIPVNSPEYRKRVSEVMETVRERSPANIARIESEFLDEGVKKGWFESPEAGRQILDAEVQRLTEMLSSGNLKLTNNFSIDLLEDVFEAGKLKTKFDTDSGWFKKGKFNEKAKRMRVEDNLGIGGLNPKYAGLGGGTGAWGEVQAVIDIKAVKGQSTFSHYDSFFAGTSKDAASTSQLTLSDAIRSKAVLNVEKRGNKEYNKVGSDKVYTESQVLGEVSLGQEIVELQVPESFRHQVEKLLEKYPQYKNLITYE